LFHSQPNPSNGFPYPYQSSLPSSSATQSNGHSLRCPSCHSHTRSRSQETPCTHSSEDPRWEDRGDHPCHSMQDHRLFLLARSSLFPLVVEFPLVSSPSLLLLNSSVLLILHHSNMSLRPEIASLPSLHSRILW
ncbi:hypothetical protein PENTCL1PPCAC_26953, partial [Pristionchus entomophagus]